MYMKHIYNWFFFKDDTCVKTKKTYHTTQSIYHETTSTIFSNDEGTKHNVHDRMEHSRYYTYNLIGISIFLSLHKNIFFRLCLLLRYLINMICLIFFVFIYYYFFFCSPNIITIVLATIAATAIALGCLVVLICYRRHKKGKLYCWVTSSSA